MQKEFIFFFRIFMTDCKFTGVGAPAKAAPKCRIIHHNRILVDDTVSRIVHINPD